MTRTSLIVATALTLVACAPPLEDQMAELTLEELRAGLRDPGSLQLYDTRIRVGTEWGAICGSYNAANGYGGMAGRQRFVRVFGPDEMRNLRSTDSTAKVRRAGWEAHQTKFAYEDEANERLPLLERKERMRGLFIEPEEPILTIARTADRCVAGAEPITLEP